MQPSYTRLKFACYTSNVAMSVVSNLSPLLFLTFRSLYGLSYSLLGLLVLINFVTQLSIDLIFSFFSHKFNIEKTVKAIPILTASGLLLYAAAPLLFPNTVYLGLVLGTVIFAASGGLVEVLLSPVIAAIPSENPDREMSKLHSIYAWGVVFIVLFASLFLLLFGAHRWQWLVLLFVLIPLCSATLFFGAKFPPIAAGERAASTNGLFGKKILWVFVLGIFLGGASECTMAQWSSGYLEAALEIPKIWGDIFGVALFAMTLGLGRTLYAKYGTRIERILLLGAIGAVACYFVAAVSSVSLIGLIACALTGFCTSMLWPGSLIAVADRIPTGGVVMYAMMAAGGDLGASVGPQLVGIITDKVMVSQGASELAMQLGITAEQLGMKCGMLVGMIFPLLAIPVFLYLLKSRKKKE
ncbi:MAG: MFS transporter [Clostridia bacterium]|nr:MFS transporter [Clostridia bacterium]